MVAVVGTRSSETVTVHPEMDKIVYCLCGTIYDPNKFMIQCDICKDWLHGSCCNFQEYTAIEVDRFHCPRCIPANGPSVYKPYLNTHRHEYWDPKAAFKAVQTGTPDFICELGARRFAEEGEVVVRMSGYQLAHTLLKEQKFTNPIVVENPEGLGMMMPPANFSLYDVEAFVGGDTDLEVIDVTRQVDIKMKLRDYVGYYNSLSRRRIFNIISLEFSNTALGQLVEAPIVARILDWANAMWPQDYVVPPPQVQKYCLMSVKHSFTDFHIDFGGSSVWYHVMHGVKIFYFIKPSPSNLMLYRQWMNSNNQSELFFGDQVDRCYQCIVRQGQTMLIPSGWIHAVYTPTDSLVFGGNFLHSLNIVDQLEIYDTERSIKTLEKFIYPQFEGLHWFTLQNMYYYIKELNGASLRCPNNLLTNLKSLIAPMKRWIANRHKLYYGKSQVPECINHVKLFKEVGREIRIAEKYIHILEPPKPERESKRTRKRPFNKDFVDYSLSPSSSLEHIPQCKPASKRIPPLKLTLPKPSTYPYKSRAAKKKPAAVAASHATADAATADVATADVATTVAAATTEDVDWRRPEETTAVHRGGAVLQFRLGTKDLARTRTQSDEVSSTSTLSVYDFHDDSEEEEETPPIIHVAKKAKRVPKKKNAARRKKRTTAAARAAAVAAAANATRKWFIKNPIIEQEEEEEVEEVEEVEAEDTVDYPFNDIESPEAIVTNSFIESEAEPDESLFSPDTTVGLIPLWPDASGSSEAPVDEILPFPEEEVINQVHQDDEYIYPSLDNSDDDDEDVQIFKPRGRSSIDEPWCPKAKLGPLIPKMNRPSREGTKKQAVEKGLEAAAAKRASEPVEKSPKRKYRKRKPKAKPEKKRPASPQPSTSTSTASSPSTSAATSTTPTQKLRKGMKTVKQRLGKILKIHKMIH